MGSIKLRDNEIFHGEILAFASWQADGTHNPNGFGNGYGDIDAEGYGYGLAVGEGEYSFSGTSKIGLRNG